MKETNKSISDKFNVCDKEGNLKDVPKLNLNYGGRGTKQTFSQLVKGFNKHSVCNDLTDTQTVTVLKHILNSKLEDSEKRVITQQFMLNWTDLDSIDRRIRRG
jgi:hypothetical protein